MSILIDQFHEVSGKEFLGILFYFSLFLFIKKKKRLEYP